MAFVSMFGDQQRVIYMDIYGTIWDSWYDGPTDSWNLQQINADGQTNGPPAAWSDGTLQWPLPVFVSVFGDQQHFAYVGGNAIIWDA